MHTFDFDKKTPSGEVDGGEGWGGAMAGRSGKGGRG